LKKSFISAQILHHFNPERKIVLEREASNLIITIVLAQYDDHTVFHPITYVLKKHSLAEINYEIYNKELLAIIQAFKE
jgi:hypothetical protein